MCKKICLDCLLIVLLSILPLTTAFATEGGILFSSAALKEYGIEKFEPGHAILDNIGRRVKGDVGSIEEDNDVIDTESEAAIALWLASPQKIQTLPRNKLGAQRLCFDLFPRRTVNTARTKENKGAAIGVHGRAD